MSQVFDGREDKKECLRKMYKYEIIEIINKISKSTLDEVELIFKKRFELLNFEENFIEKKLKINKEKLKYLINNIGINIFIILAQNLDLKDLIIFINEVNEVNKESLRDFITYIGVNDFMFLAQNLDLKVFIALVNEKNKESLKFLINEFGLNNFVLSLNNIGLEKIMSLAKYEHEYHYH